jgi:hypothetical protein
LSDFNEQVFEKHSNIKFMKICPVEVKLFHGGYTDMKKLSAVFHNVMNAPKKG